MTTENKATFKVSFITAASIFILGYINAFALNTHDLGSMITPQSGNIIWLGINAASGYWSFFANDLGLFFGFIGGVIFVLFTKNIFKNTLQFFFNWTMFVLPVMLYPLIMQYVVPSYISFFILGFASGVALGNFRRIYHLEINNAMATGNVRFLGIHFAGAFLRKNKNELADFWIFLLCVFLFAFGAFFYTIFAQFDYNLGLDGRGYIIGLGDHNFRAFRQTLGFSEYRIDVISSNIVRVVGLIVFCTIPYFFFPKNTVTEQ